MAQILLGKYNVTLNIDVETYQANSTLLNRFVRPDIKIKSLNWGKMLFYNEGDKNPFSDVSDDKFDKVIYKETQITIESNNVTETFYNSNGFTSRNLFDHIMSVETEARPNTDWFGGIDAHHIYFEGLHKTDNRCYSVYWGS